MEPLDRRSKLPLFQQLIQKIIDDIQNGTLAPGDRLLPERKMAALYGVNRSTVNHALEELTSLGWLTRRQGSGTHVAQGRLGSRQAPQNQWRQLLAQRRIKEDPYLTQLQALRQQATDDILDLASGDLPLSLIPDFRFPPYTWEQILKENRQTDATGYYPLKAIIQERLLENFGLKTEGQDLLITSGSTQGINLVLQTLLQPGDTIATEDPSFLFALPLFQTLGLHLEGIPCDAEGLLPQALEKQIITKRIKLLYLNPTFQNPTGRTMSLNRRKSIIQVCEKYMIPIIEDDVFGELDFGPPLPKLKVLAPQQVIYLSSLSKIFSGNIKIGWLQAPKSLVMSIANTKTQLDAETNLFPQLLANAALRSPDYQHNHQQLIQHLQQRSRNFTEAMRNYQEDWHFQSINGGLYYWLIWQHQPLTRKNWQYFFQEKLLVAPSFLFTNDTMAMRVNYTQLTTDNVQDFCQRLDRISTNLKRGEKNE